MVLGYPSFFRTIMTAWGDWVFGIRTGNLIVVHMPNSDIGRNFGIVEFWPIDGGKVYDILAQPPHSTTTHLTIPLGIPLAILMGLTFLLRPRRQPLRKLGYCPNCNYDVRANWTGVCSECGAKIPVPLMTPKTSGSDR